MNQWRNTSSVIKWFKNLPEKNKSKFLNFDIIGFYSSISEKLFKNAIPFVKKFTAASDNTIKIILNVRKSLLFYSNNPWMKKTGENFDVAMGSFDGAEICEFVGLFLLDRLASVLGKKNVGLYRDDGLAVLRNISGPTMERTRKKIIRVFQAQGLRITSECNLSRTDFLDVCFDLNEEAYIPDRKPNNTPLYIHDQSIRLPIIKKHLQQMIGQRISYLSCDKAAFEKAAPEYNQALQKSGFKHTIMYKLLQSSLHRSNNNNKKTKKRCEVVVELLSF